MFLYCDELKNGYNSIIELDGNGKDMMMDVGVLCLAAGDTFSFCEKEKEVALMVLEGDAAFEAEGKSLADNRTNPYEDLPFGVLFAKGHEMKVSSEKGCDIYVQKSLNERDYETCFYPKDSVMLAVTGEGILDDTMHRKVRTMFDYDTAPFSNMVLGDTINKPGRWSGYIPHIHPQPEVYFYRFDKPQGFGAGFEGDNVYKLKNNSLLMISSNAEHPQVTAPGYAMMTVWGIRHNDGDPWVRATSCYEPEEHKWMREEGAVFANITK